MLGRCLRRTSHLLHTPHHTHQHKKRLRFAARALRLRVNLLLLDTDVVLLDDPYKYLRAPPLADKTVVLQVSLCGCVCGGVGGSAVLPPKRRPPAHRRHSLSPTRQQQLKNN